MSEPNPRRSNLAHVIADMEGDVNSVGRWAEVLMAVGTATHLIPPAAIYAIGEALHELNASIEEQHERAFRLAHPEAEQAGVKPCP